MEDWDISELIDALVEDYTLEELKNDSSIITELVTLTKLSQEQAKTLLDGAIEVSSLRKNYLSETKQLLALFLTRH